MRIRIKLIPLAALAFTCNAGSLNKPDLQTAFNQAAKGFKGRAGVCAQDSTGAVCVNGDQRFSLQSVVKLIAGMAVMDSVDRKGWKLDEPILVRREDLSLYVQPIEKLVTADGYRTTTADLIRRAIVDSDSAAVDILIRKLGSARNVQDYLERSRIAGIRVDRDERHLQTEIVGITWKPEYVDPEVLDRAIKAVPNARRTTAYKRYQTDVRDTATPRGMASLLQGLADEKILSPASSRHIIDVMKQTVTFPDRLKAGAPAGWIVAHKTGSSGSWNGVAAATNDVGILIAPDGTKIAIAVLLGDSTATPEVRSALMAKLARLTTEHYRAQ